MSAKYQVFVSSTYRDLSEERDLVIKSILEMGHIPVGMEMFSAADEEQWNIIKKQIDQSDYYVVLVAHRYGSCDSDGLSYTEKEYDYATSKGIPTLGFIIDEGTTWPREKSDIDKTTRKRLTRFKDKVKAKPISFWRNGEDLYGKCSISLTKAFNAYPREGWIRASLVQDTAASKEVIRLSAENAELRTRLEIFLQASNEEAAIAKAMATMRSNKVKLNVWKKGATDWEVARELTLYQIFETIGPELQIEIELGVLALFAATNLAAIPHNALRETWPTPRNTIRAILADFAALECSSPSKKKKPVFDQKEYWTLTEFGRKLLARMRLRRLNKSEDLAAVNTSMSKDSKADL